MSGNNRSQLDTQKIVCVVYHYSTNISFLINIKYKHWALNIDSKYLSISKI